MVEGNPLEAAAYPFAASTVSAQNVRTMLTAADTVLGSTSKSRIRSSRAARLRLLLGVSVRR